MSSFSFWFFGGGAQTAREFGEIRIGRGKTQRMNPSPRGTRRREECASNHGWTAAVEMRWRVLAMMPGPGLFPRKFKVGGLLPIGLSEPHHHGAFNWMKV